MYLFGPEAVILQILEAVILEILMEETFAKTKTTPVKCIFAGVGSAGITRIGAMSVRPRTAAR